MKGALAIAIIAASLALLPFRTNAQIQDTVNLKTSNNPTEMTTGQEVRGSSPFGFALIDRRLHDLISCSRFLFTNRMTNKWIYIATELLKY